MKKSVLISAVILLAMLLSACGEAAQPAGQSGSGSKDAAQTIAEAQTEAAAEETRPRLGVPDSDYDGADFTIMALKRGVDGNDMQFTEFTYDPERSGEGINDAIYQRNLIVEEKYNVKISVSEQADSSALASNLQKIVTAGDNTIYAATPLMPDALITAQNGIVLDLNMISLIDQSKPWWNKASNEGSTINGKLFCIVGDLSKVVPMLTRAIREPNK